MHTKTAHSDRITPAFCHPDLLSMGNLSILRDRPMLALHHTSRPWMLCLALTLSAVGTMAQNDLFISEYVESSSNKCIEIFNPTGHAITLNGSYRLRISSNGNPLSTLSNLSGTIPSKGVHVVCSFSSSYSYDQSWGVGGPNGNDAIVLEKNGAALDVFGNVGCANPPASAWQDGGIRTEDVTLVRKSCVKSGVRSDPGGDCPFPTLADEWVDYPSGTLSHLGTHAYFYQTPTVSTSDPSDCHTDDGVIQISAVRTDLQYSIDDGRSWGSMPDFTGLSEGIYDVVVRVSGDHRSCYFEKEVELSASSKPSLSIPRSVCEDSAPISLSATQDGVQGSWSGRGVDMNTFDPSGLSGRPLLTFTPDPGQCAKEVAKRITIDPVRVARLDDLDPICASAVPISLRPTQKGVWGTWTGPGVRANRFDPNGLVGKQPLTFTPKAGECALPVTDSIEVLAAPEIVAMVAPPACPGDSNGYVIVEARHGLAPILFDWDVDGSGDFDDQDTLRDLRAGNYHLEIRDANQCVDKSDFLLLDPDPLTLNFTVTPESVVGGQDGRIIVEARGGRKPYTYQWNTGQSMPDISRLRAKTYIVTVTDDTQCQIVDSARVTVDCNLEANTIYNGIICYGSNSAEATLQPVGGTRPFQYQWSHDAMLRDSFAQQLDTGLYTVTLTDAKGCSIVEVFDIRQHSELLVTATVDHASGSIDLQVQGGLPSYTFAWSSGQNVASLQQLDPGHYSVTVTDAFGCEKVERYQIEDQTCALRVTAVVDDLACATTPRGKVTIEVQNPTTPVSYQWSHDSLLRSDVATGLSAGHYEVTVTDAAGCTEEMQLTVTAPDSIKLNATVRHVTADGASDGSIALTPAHGSQPYSFQWAHGATDQMLSDLAPGAYRATVTDARGCQASIEVEIQAFEDCRLQVKADVTPASCDRAPGAVLLSIVNASGPPSIRWSDPAYDGQLLRENLAPGVYPVTVQDDLCTLADTIRIPYMPLDVDYYLQHSYCDSTTPSLFHLTSVRNGTPPYDITLDGVLWPSDQVSLPLVPGRHHWQVVDAMGCAVADSFEFTSTLPEIRLPSDTVIKRGQTISLVAQVPDLVPWHDYFWSDRDGPLCQGCTEISVQPRQTTLYQFRLVSDASCQVVKDVTVHVNRNGLLYIPNAITPNGDGINDHWQVFDGLDLVERILSLEIFDRRGVRLFTKADLAANQPVPELDQAVEELILPGVFIYQVEVMFKQGQRQTYRGDLTIIK